MFENYVVAKKTKRAAWVTWLVLGSVVIHAGAAAGLLIWSWLRIDRLDTPIVQSSAGVQVAIAAPPPKGSPSAKPKARIVQPKEEKIKVDAKTVQPEKRKEEKKEDPGDEGENIGVPEGVEGGIEGGLVGSSGNDAEGVIGVAEPAPPPPPPPPPPPKVENTTPTALEALRISGDKNIVPDDVTKTEISRSGKSRLTIPAKICLTEGGRVKSVSILKSSGFPKYDAKIKKEMQAWKYRPFTVNGKATPVCAAVTLIYVQKN